MFHLPEPLTQQSLAGLVKDRRYRDRRDPEHKSYRDFVTSAYRSFYGEAGGVDRGVARSGGGVVHVRGYTRVVDGKLQHVQAYERRGPWSDRPNVSFREKIAAAEQSAGKLSDGYGERNKVSRALGRYQLTPIALEEAGWRNKNGTWTAKARAKGVRSENNFLDKPEAQEDALDDYLKAIEKQANTLGLLSHVGEKISGPQGEVTVTESGIMAAAHRQGAPRTADYFRERSGIRVQRPLTEKERNRITTRLREFQNVPYQRMSPHSEARPQRSTR